MDEFFRSVWWMLVSLSVLITVHEFGHFWVARRCGVKVLRFSVGFGRALWSYTDRHGTQFTLAIIPYGGFVKMLDERNAPVPAEEMDYAFNRKSVWKRIAIVAAGPIANIVLCSVLLWVSVLIGRRDYAPIIGHVEGLAATAQLRPGDRLLRIDHQVVNSYSEATVQLVGDAMDRQDAHLIVQSADQNPRSLILPLSQLPHGFDEQRIIEQAGITWQFLLSPTVVDGVLPGSAADGHLLSGDRLLAINTHDILSPDNLYQQIQRLGATQTPLEFSLMRGQQHRIVQLSTPHQNHGHWLIGIRLRAYPLPAFDSKLHYNPVAAVPIAVTQTLHLAKESLKMLERIVTGRASVHNISGPVTIARIAGDTAARGADWFLYFLALMSLSLAIVNLLPIPVLDGGHLLYYLIELIKGGPLSERAVAIGQYIGLGVLAGLMGLAFYNDILRLVMR